MEAYMAKPAHIDDETLDEYLVYLDSVRESGVTNMFGAAQYLVAQFNMPRADARAVLAHWMETFSERHQEEGR
jgi:hypothetical protein